jgi:hypothetical protein
LRAVAFIAIRPHETGPVFPPLIATVQNDRAKSTIEAFGRFATARFAM